MRIIADSCSNHLGDIDTIMKMIKSAADIGCDFIKFQLYNADNLNKDWDKYDEAYEYYKKCQLSDKMISQIMLKCKRESITPLFTAFGLDQAERLLKVTNEYVKIASPDMSNWGLVKFCIENFDRTFISTGMHHGNEIKKLFGKYPKRFMTGQIVPFFCRSIYPTESYREKDIISMRYFSNFALKWGISDHSADCNNVIALYDMFCEGTLNFKPPEYVERHFTLEKSGKKDDIVSSLPEDMVRLTNYPIVELSQEEIAQRKYITRWKK